MFACFLAFPVEKPGLILEVKDAFAKFDHSGNFVKWLDEMPYGELMKEIREIKRVRGKYAVVCGRFPTKDSTWEVRTIWINNPVLQAILFDVFKDHPDVTCGGDILEFKAPFVPLIHRWEQLCKLAHDNAGSEKQELMKLFVNMLKEELQDTLSRVKRVRETGCASWEDLKFVFKPGQLFFRSEAPIAAGISQTYIGGFLSVHRIAWTGSDYSTVKSSFVVPVFHGTRPLSDLIVRPIWACPENDVNSLKAALIRRGPRLTFLSENEWNPQNCNSPKERRLPIQPTEGRVIVDADGCDEDWSRYVGPLYDLNLHGIMKTDGDDSKVSNPDEHKELQQVSDPKTEEGDGSDRLTDEEVMLTVSTVNCFSIERKVWCCAEIDHLTDIEWNTQAINNLVIDEAEKRLLVGFVGATKNGKLQHFDDFVHGKGKGVVMLLCGPPGTGKTFTAESVSENLKRPLYRIDSSDLGMDTSKLEGNLKTALDRCARWDAILLLDEADVFLEKRTSSNLTQNEMTTIFLRLLEYYKGLMILTTNRYPAIDPAFESRIDLSFVFQDLEPASRAKIWYNFLDRENKVLAEDSNAIAKLASMPLNGRQIKSAVKTARILAASENLPLAVDHLQTVVFMRMKALKMLE
ncbi:P-loop containing nucleoside triphosphate hydrolase [Fusarium acutatum]|uniref:P-loop containing nucleoside triphosphate hydrolase n=1 Tax=Fusarium acutatum TaxID=78861 RepID=A0A8H4K314_9HYPO|nr:P-loop containing nucleoside triphosphate hydrolase [Fusarium acutatum]